MWAVQFSRAMAPRCWECGLGRKWLLCLQVGKVLSHPNHPITLYYSNSDCIVVGIENDPAMRRGMHEALVCGIGGAIEGSGFAGDVGMRAVELQSFAENRFAGKLVRQYVLQSHEGRVSASGCLQP